MRENFERCDKCNGRWFTVHKQVAVTKGSSKYDPEIYKEIDIYQCIDCGSKQFVKKSH